MENGTLLSGRRRGYTKHAVEDQALDQITKEKIVSLSGGKSDDADNDGTPKRDSDGSQLEDNDSDVVISTKKSKRHKKKKKKLKADRETDDEAIEKLDNNACNAATAEKSKSKLILDKFIGKVPEAVREPIVSGNESDSNDYKTLLKPVQRLPVNSNDKSHENSTSRDVSELSGRSSPADDVDFWKDIEKNELRDTKESVNFDDFWADFEEGVPRKTQIVSSDTNIERDERKDDERSSEVVNVSSEIGNLEHETGHAENVWGDSDQEEKQWEQRIRSKSMPTDSLVFCNKEEKEEDTEISKCQQNNEDLENIWEDEDKVWEKRARLRANSVPVNSNIEENTDFWESDEEEKRWREKEKRISSEVVFSSTSDKNRITEMSSSSDENSTKPNEDLCVEVNSAEEDSKTKDTDMETNDAENSCNVDDYLKSIVDIDTKNIKDTGMETENNSNNSDTESSSSKRGSASLSRENNTTPKDINGNVEKLDRSLNEDIETAKAPTPPPLPSPVILPPKEIHKRTFNAVLKDIEHPPRRRSVVPLEDRERRRDSYYNSENSAPSRGKRTDSMSSYSEDDFGIDYCIIDYLGKENNKAEARLAARRLARVEAREIRLKEIERQQREQEEGADKFGDFHGAARTSTNMSPRDRTSLTNSYHSSRRSSEDSMDDGLSLRDIRHELKEVEEKFRKAMIANAQLDNEKAALSYQVELFKDKLEELEDSHTQLGREQKEKCRELEALKRAATKLREDVSTYKACLEERDRLIADYGLVAVGGEIGENGEITPRVLVTQQSADILATASVDGSLDVRLKRFVEEKEELVDEVRHLKLELEEERNKWRNDKFMSNGPVDDELHQTLADYRFRLQKAEQDVSTLQATVARLESQVIRYKTAAETSEKSEEDLKQEKRRLQREQRESMAKIEELETANSHLQRRMDKLKNAKSTLLKEL